MIMHPAIPEEYSLRQEINDEIHTRPYEVLSPPEQVSYIALLVNEEDRAREWAHFAELCQRYDVSLPEKEQKHLRFNFGDFRLKVERHHEFTRYEFVKHGAFSRPFKYNVTDSVPADWLANLPGKTLVAAHVAIELQDPPQLPDATKFYDAFGDLTIIGARIGRNAILAFSDFRIHEDGFSRFLIIAHDRFPAQTGRLILRLLEMETYRMLALMGLPLARSVNAALGDADSRLSTLTDAIASGSEADDEKLLDELSEFAVKVENLVSGSYYRFAATHAYFAVVANRLAELREMPIEGVATFGGYLKRRLEPARETCDAASARLDQLSARTAQASQLLRTRVDVEREKQNQQLLAAMNKRFGLQLHLQLTVERLSIAVFTYYSVNLIEYMAQAANEIFGSAMNTFVVKAASIPFVALFAYLIGGKVRKAMRRAEEKESV